MGADVSEPAIGLVSPRAMTWVAAVQRIDQLDICKCVLSITLEPIVNVITDLLFVAIQN